MTATHSFTLLKETHIPEINTHVKHYRHVKSGAELLSLQNDDENKCFGITFRTPPSDSTGVAHIMEHAVLCGSRKYPLKEPFVELIKGSLNTFLNAFTFPDKTCYPIASQNLKDFYNLVDVYLDAVFYPLIPSHTLEQEGWHYELENPDDPLIYKGVVFNEMKGNYSSPDSMLETYSHNALFPNNTYQYDPGGDPKVIPDLTYEQFKAFHETYYHPSNARIFFYGDDDPTERLRLLDCYLSEFDAVEVNSTIALQPRFDVPRRFTYGYDAGQEPQNGNKGMLAVHWMLTENRDSETTMGLAILSHILLGTPASPLRKTLIESGLGEDLTGGGVEEQLRQMTFGTGMKGIALEDADRVETLILQTLDTLAEEGIDPATVEASLNTTEFALRENNTGGFPRGLVLMVRSLINWIYDDDPIEPLFYETPLQAIKDHVAAGEPYFENLIRQYLFLNSHRVTVLLEPDPEFRAREDAVEKAHLAQVRNGMSEDDLKHVVENTRKLKIRQETPDSPEALASLPFLQLDDLEKKNKSIPKEELQEGGTKILYHDLFTNGIVYLEIGFDLHTLPQELLPYVPLFSRGLLEMGTENEDFVRLTQRIGQKTGGLYPTTLNSASRNGKDGAFLLFLRGKATIAQADDLLDIIRDVVLTVKFDNQERFRQMVMEAKAGKESGLIPSGHAVVNTRLKSRFNESHWVSEQMGGLTNLFFVRELVEKVENDWPAVLEKLEQIRSILFNRNAAICNVTLDIDNWTKFRPRLADLLADLPSAPVRWEIWTPGHPPAFEGLTIPAQVNYVSKGANLFDLGYVPHGSLLVIRKFLVTTWLWEKIRVQGGAYGGFATYDRLSGVFTFLSYRDPNLIGTLDNYDGTGAFLRKLDLSQDELTKSIIGTIGDMDPYQLPDAKGFTSLLRHVVGVTDEERQQLRDEILTTTQADFKAFAETLDQINKNGHIVVMGSPEAIQTANDKRGEDWLEVTRVL